MKTLNSKKSKANLKLALGLLVAGLTFTAPTNTTTVHAELVDETDEWKEEGEQHNEEITPQEQEQHDNQPDPSVQDAQPVVNNEQGGVEPSNVPNPPPHNGNEGNSDPTKGEVTDWIHYDPTTDPTWDPINPKLPDDLEDEVDKKTTPTPTPQPTPTPGPKPTPTPGPVNPVNPVVPVVPVVPVKPVTPVVKTTVPKAGAETLPYIFLGGGIAGLGASLWKVNGSRKTYRMHKKIQKVLKKTK